MPSYTTWDDHSEEGGWPVALYSCQGSQTQVWHCPISQAYNCQWNKTQTPHHARPSQTAKGLGQGICHEDVETIQLVARVPLFVPGVHKWAPHNLCTAVGQETGCRFPASCRPSQKIQMVGSSLSLSTLFHNDFLPPGDLKGSWDIQEIRKEKTLALARALQSYFKQSGGLYSIMYSTARDLQGGMANLVQFEQDDILEILLLEPTDDLPIVSPTLEEEAAFISEPPEAQATATCPLRCVEWAPKPESVARMGEAVTESQGMWKCPPLPGFDLLPPEHDVPLIGVPDPNEVHSILMPVSTISLIVYRNEITGDLKYKCKTQYLSLCIQSHLVMGQKLLSYGSSSEWSAQMLV